MPEHSMPEVELSVVIPTYNRPDALRACVESLIGQDGQPPSLELIVVVDGPDPSTEAMLGSLLPPFPLRVVVQPHAGQAVARNRGVEEARGCYVLFLDDDVVAESRLVGAHLEALRSGDRVVGVGRIDKVLSPRAPDWARSRQAVWRSHYDRLAGGRQPRFNDTYGGNLSVRRDLFMEVGGFATDIPVEHDVELGYRLAAARARFVYVPDAIAREGDRDTLRHFLSDARRRGMVSVELYRRHPGLLPYLRLGGAGQLGRPWIALRMVLSALRLSAYPLALLGSGLRLERLTGRWSGFLYTYCYWDGVRTAVDRDTWRRLQRGAAILMYHAIAGDGEQPGRYVLPLRSFERQMQWLRRRGYNVIGLDELVAYLGEHRLLPPKTVVLTFDDGYRDNADLALPVLERFGFPATCFLVSGSGGRPSWDCVAELRSRPLLAPAEAGELLDGLSLGAHSRTHPRLPGLELDEVEPEVAGSKADLETALGRPVTTFAYPYGATSPEVRAAVAAAGFLAACGITEGLNRHATDIYDLHRLEVRGTDSLLRFALTLWLAGRPSLTWPRLRRTRLDRQ
ncbi:MAG: glycosyltransferase [Verrucomicrobiota bacterium]